MKTKMIWIAALIFLLSGSASFATDILDNYWGANDHGYGDIVGDASLFDISKMSVSFNGGNLIVDIYSRYLDNIGTLSTQLGDLFLSTNGWNPLGSAPYAGDNATNGEGWEYALVLNNHTATSGTLNLYKLSDGGSINLSYAPSGYIWRDGQEVQFNPGQTASIATGSWSIQNLGGSDTDDYLRFVIGFNNLAMSGGVMGFHWGMSCANDVIEGSVDISHYTPPVPEPASMLLLGSGLVGVGVAARRKFGKKA